MACDLCVCNVSVVFVVVVGDVLHVVVVVVMVHVVVLVIVVSL